MATTTKPLPEITNTNRPFWDATAKHELRIQRCASCGRHQYPAIDMCPEDGSALEWVDASGDGTLYTFTIFRQPYHPAFVDDVPYNVAIVELAEGPLMLSAVVDCDLDALAIGMPLRVTYDVVVDGVTLPKFTPARA